MGGWTRRFVFEYPKRVRLLGVHFKPWGMSPFVDLPASDLHDRWLPADAVWPPSLVERIRDQVGEIESATEALQIVETVLRSRSAAALSGGFPLVQHAGRRLETSWGQSRSVH